MGTLALSLLVTLAPDPFVPLPRVPAEPMLTDVPLAPEPDDGAAPDRGGTVDPFVGGETDDGRYEIGGFMKRPPPPAPLLPEREPELETRRGELVWGPHTAAPWTRQGLIASAAISGVGVVGAIVSWPIAQHRLIRVERRIAELRQRGSSTPTHPREACRDVELALRPSGILVSDVELADRCLKFKRMRAVHGVAIGVAAAGAVAAVTFAILHRVHRSDQPRRLEARSDGFALRF